MARSIGSRGGRALRLRIMHAANTLKAAASDVVNSAADVEATAAELAAKQRADSAMHALLVEVRG